MSNASTAIAEIGYGLYRTTDPRPSLEQLNAVLAAQGLGPVSPRMHDHYRRLERDAQPLYVTINEFDVRRRRRRDG